MNKFDGFEQPEQNWSKLPHELIEQLPRIESQSELAVILYVLRHTWGFQEFEEVKKITLDEFQHGRKKRNGDRLDKGVGMSRSSVIRGLEKAEEHGFIIVVTDESDKARITKRYRINTTEVSKRYHGDSEAIPRSEKDTSDKNLSNNNNPEKTGNWTGYLTEGAHKSLVSDRKTDTVSEDERKKKLNDAIQAGVKTYQAIKGDVEKHLGITPQWNYKTGKDLYQYLRERYEEGETVKEFAEWWREDWRSSGGHSPPSVKQISELWPSAFKKQSTAPPKASRVIR